MPRRDRCSGAYVTTSSAFNVIANRLVLSLDGTGLHALNITSGIAVWNCSFPIEGGGPVFPVLNHLVVTQPGGALYVVTGSNNVTLGPMVMSTSSFAKLVPLKYLVTFPTTVGGSDSLTLAHWYAVGQKLSVTATPQIGYSFVDWSSSAPSISIASPTSLTSVITVNGTGMITPIFNKAGLKLSLKPSLLSVIHGNHISTTATISGAAQSVTLTVRGLPTGTKISWSKGSSLKDSISGVTDKLTLSTTKLTPIGTYSITIVATGADGQKSTAKLTLKVT